MTTVEIGERVFDLTDETSRLVAADAKDEAGLSQDAYVLRNLKFWDAAASRMGSTAKKYQTVRRGIGHLRAGDWAAFRSLVRRSKTFSFSVNSQGGRCSVHVWATGTGVVAEIMLPENVEQWQGMGQHAALRACGLSL